MSTEEQVCQFIERMEEYVDLIAGGHVSRYSLDRVIAVLRDQAQRHNRQRAKKAYIRRVKDGAAYWEERYPGRGKAVMKVLQPFINWTPTLNKPVADLNDLASEAIFWRRSEGVQTLPKVTYLNRLPWEESLPHALRSMYRVGPRTSVLDSLRGRLQVLFDGLDRRFIAASSVPSRAWWHYKEGVYMSFFSTVICPIALIIGGEYAEAAKFHALHELFLRGNFPIGFGPQYKLIVLTAD